MAVCVLGILFAVPNILSREMSSRLPAWLQPVNLGLDLQGGSHLLIEVGIDDVTREQLTNLAESVRAGFRQVHVHQRNLTVTTEGVTVLLPHAEQHEAARQLIRELDRSVRIEQENEETFRLSYSEEILQKWHNATVIQAIKIVRQRVDEAGTREAAILRQGSKRFIVELPGVDDPARIKHLIGRTAKLTLHLVDDRVTPGDVVARHMPPGTHLLPGVSEGMLPIRKRVVVAGDDLVDAQPSFQNGQPVVHFRFNPLGGRKFRKMTQENVGKRLAIVLDGKVISAPVIREPILGGSGVISGRFTTQEAQDLAMLLRAGALPAPLTYLEERTVGPSLGADSIRAGAIACVVGLGLVVVFMGGAYGLFGLFADLALLVNLVLLIGLLSAIGATLTLPGIAGIVLTLGMAVDANVLIYERVREEQRNGRATLHALEAGFQRAFTTILDSNLTTLVAALLLFQFGSGPVRGFAVTLGFGILTSLFSAIMITRFLIVQWVYKKNPKMLPFI
ncbi:Protein-export membrane protein SecD (TC 3.A.5.1.1) [invertebrate metagenome]|uniref:Protein-export membrane protein SecD (TC 3.A.5.1.1) n=1 Tax=invertebrate metagenome TaxID=1711999 RepID=A0A484H6Q3_9ZZZZ